MSGGSASGDTAERQRSTNTQASKDAALAERIRQEFAGDTVLRDTMVSVRCNNGLVTLSGSVPTYQAREDAEKLALSINDVKSVENRITVN